MRFSTLTVRQSYVTYPIVKVTSTLSVVVMVITRGPFDGVMNPVGKVVGLRLNAPSESVVTEVM